MNIIIHLRSGRLGRFLSALFPGLLSSPSRAAEPSPPAQPVSIQAPPAVESSVPQAPLPVDSSAPSALERAQFETAVITNTPAPQDMAPLAPPLTDEVISHESLPEASPEEKTELPKRKSTPSAKAKPQVNPEPALQVREDVPPPVRREERSIIIGVDFGTSTTKVIWQDLSEQSFEAMPWHTITGRPNSYLLPSTILIRDGKLHFGLSPDQVREGDRFLQTIKLCVLCEKMDNVCRCGNAGGERGNFLFEPAPQSTSASALASLFLAFVFAAIETHLKKRYPHDELVLIWNLGCPMDHRNADNLKEKWERIAGVAMGLRNREKGTADLAVLTDAENLLRDFTPPDIAYRDYLVQPEGLAAVKAFLESPLGEIRSYAIVDIGAGTTEVSLFFNGRAMNEPGRPFRPSYLADTTVPIGGVRIDQELSRLRNCSMEEARTYKESTPAVSVPPECKQALCQNYAMTVQRAVARNLLIAENDMRLDLFVVGGGGRLKDLRVALTNTNLPGHFRCEQLRTLTPPGSLITALPEGYDVFAIACGLASSLTWDYFDTGEVDPLPELRVAQHLDRDADR